METEIFKRKLPKPETKSASRILGKCPCPGCDGYVSLNADKTEYACSRYIRKKCNFHVRIDYFIKRGKPTIPAKMMERLLNDEILTCNSFLDTRDGTPLNHPTELQLKYIEKIKAFGIDAKILWDEWV